MKMDGYDVLVGDSVFDVTRGPGVVESVGDDRFVVAFRDLATTYTGTGHGGFSRRTLYWADPVPVAPSKDAGVRDLAGKLWASIYQTLKGEM